jgi:uncharacterized membrane protein
MDADPHRLRVPALMAGFALGGFLDGILLHQILQWHHLLSGVTDPADLRFQMLWDGVFHAVHYGIAVLGLVLLWQRRQAAAAAGAGRAMLAAALVGFGAWHLIDAVVNHWLLGLHRINETVADPLPWDLAFFGLGLAAVLAGLLIARRGGQRPGRGAAAALGVALLLAAPVAAIPPPAEPDEVVARLAADLPLPAFCASWSRYADR